ncbi:MAG: glycosyltransferase [Limisphaerales bacterium]
MAGNAAISVVVPTFNRAEYLRRSIQSLLAQNAAFDYEIIIIDDGSTDGTREVCREFAGDARVKCHPEINRGIAAAKNHGAELAQSDLVLFFDDDDVADPNLLAEHVKSHTEFPDESIAVLGYTGWDASIKTDMLMNYITGTGGFLFSYSSLKHRQFYDYTHFWGGRASCKRSLLLKFGLFNPVFTFGSEDIELGYRLKSAAEFKVLYNESARSYMIRPLNFDAFVGRCLRQGKSQAWFSRLHPAREVQKWCLRPKAEGIWDYLKIEYERQLKWGRKLTEELNAASRQAGQFKANPEFQAKLKKLHAEAERVYCQVFTSAKYKGLVEELEKLGDAPPPAAKQFEGLLSPVSGVVKNILVIDLFIPVFNRASGCLRAFQLLKMMRELGYEVTFLAKYPQYADEYAAYLEELGIEVIAGDPVAMQAGGVFSPCPMVDYQKVLGNRRWDLAIISFWDNAEYYLPLLRKHCPETPVVIDTVDIVFQRKVREAQLLANQDAMAAALAAALANKQRELAIYRQADRLWVVTEADRSAIKEYAPAVPTDLISNVHALVKHHQEFAATRDLLFVGNFWHMPNVDAMAVFCQLVFPLIREKCPDIKLKIAGDNVPPGLKNFANESIQFLGHVPDLGDLLRSTRVSIAPLRYGAGMKGKIGEALSWGIPVVTTTIGAEGMNLVNGEDALIANSPAAFAEAVLRVYQDEALWRKLSRKGPVKVEDNWGYDVVKDKLSGALVAVMPNQPLVSIIILVMNQLAQTRACLESIAAHTPMLHEVIIVDNASTDQTPEFLKEWQATHPNYVVIRNETNRGFAGGNNQGLSIVKGKHVVLLNNDTVVTSGWLERLLEVFDRHPETGIVGPMSNNVSGLQLVKEVSYANLEEMPASAARWCREHRRQSLEVGRAVGFCLVAKREIIDAIGGLDERFGPGNFEDDDFCIRAMLAGYRIRIARDAFVHHTGSQTFKSARIDYHRAMTHNWNLFRAKWQMGDIPLENAYPVPARLPAGTEVKIPLPHLDQTHQSFSKRNWGQLKSANGNQDLPAVARVGNLDQARAFHGNRKYSDAWLATIAAIQSRPFHPEAFLLLAEIALAADDAVNGKRCAQHARKLVPDWKAPKQFLQKNIKGNAKPDWLKLPAVINSQSQRLSVCLIAKNEEKFLAHCLASIKPIAHQIIVVDTGSTDRTLEIAREFGAEIYSSTWNDDFSAPRNAALEHATGDWILVLDADEELPAAEHARLHDDMGRDGIIALRLPLINRGQEAQGRNWVPRLFRNAPGVFYRNRIHEQVFPSLIKCAKGWGMKTAVGTAELLHHGYTTEMVKDRNKVERNLQLLRMAIRENPEDANLQMNLGLELVRSGDLLSGLTHYREAYRLMSAQPPSESSPELREVLLTQLTCYLYKARAYDEIAQVLDSPLAKRNTLTASLHFALGLACFELKQFRAAVEQMRQGLAKRKQTSLAPINPDILTTMPHHCLALALKCAGENAEAEKAFKTGMAESSGSNAELRLAYVHFLVEQKRPVDALHQLHGIVQSEPANALAWRLGGEIALGRKEFLEFALNWTAEAMRQLPGDPLISGQRAEALLLSQNTAEALPLWANAINGARPPAALAAQIICATLARQPAERLQGGEEMNVSRAFVDWYRRLVNAGARETVVGLNSQVETLRHVLPSAAGVLDGVIAQMKK